MDKDTKKLLKEAKKQGFDWQLTNRGHALVTKNGNPVTTFSGTASDSRSFKNSLAAMRAAGFVWQGR